MNIYLKQGKEKFKLPVLPSSFEYADSMNNTTVNINKLGEVNIIGKRNLRTTEISSFFPAHQYDFLRYKIKKKPYQCVKLIRSFEKDPVRYINTGSNINMLCTIESFTYGEKDGTGDVYYTLELKEYRKPEIKKKKPKAKIEKHHARGKSKTKKVQVNATKRVAKKVTTTTYIVKKGDTLSMIAKRLTGSADNYRAIANQNNISNPNRIQVGQKLVIKI